MRREQKHEKKTSGKSLHESIEHPSEIRYADTADLKTKEKYIEEVLN